MGGKVVRDEIKERSFRRENERREALQGKGREYRERVVTGKGRKTGKRAEAGKRKEDRQI